MRLQDEVKIVFLGAQGCGKSCLIHAAAKGVYAEAVPGVLPPTKMPASMLPDQVSALLLDTTSGTLHSGMIEDCRKSDVVVLVYAVSQPQSLRYLRNEVLPCLRQARVSLPMLLVGTMQDTLPNSQSLEPEIVNIMNDFREIETWLECSAKKMTQVREVVLYAQRAVLHPTGPMFDTQTQQLTPRCIAALRRIFRLCDKDKDGILSDEELNAFQVVCFNTPLQPDEITGVKKVVMDKLPSGIGAKGLTLTGFLFLHALFIERGRIETTWTVLRKFGYDNELKLNDAMLNVSIHNKPDQVVELSAVGIDFLHELFHTFDRDQDGLLSGVELQELFSTAPYNPWESEKWTLCAETGAQGSITYSGFISRWVLMTMLESEKTYALLLYLGFTGDWQSAFCVSKRRYHERLRGQSTRSVFKCVVLGGHGAGKSSILDGLTGQPYIDNAAGSTQSGMRIAAKELQVDGRSLFLTLHEPSAQEVELVLSDRDRLCTCDVALFVYDSSSEASLDTAARQLKQLADLDCSVPCVFIGAQADSIGMAYERSDAVATKIVDSCTEMRIPSAIPISDKVGDTGSLYKELLHVACKPDGRIPETPCMRESKLHQAAMAKTYTYIAVGAALGVIAVVLYRCTKRSSV
mmetsp:Transcript_34896/g.66641  ORF Transcript_34896/g.66641 Transcript_34896/m.66641 type:complete len:634 (-) Transcript_34896:588-2489(-)